MASYANGRISHWMDRLGPPGGVAFSNNVAFSPGAPLPRPDEVQDLVVVGGGLTGLWTAYYAALEHPEWSICVLEARRIGYGASGRNGGWLSTLIPGNRAVYARAEEARGRDGRESVRAFQREMFHGIDETLAVLEREGIDAAQHRGGQLQVATTRAGMERIRASHRADLEHGYEESDQRLLDAAEVRERIDVVPAVGGRLTTRTARVDPARLTRGLAEAAARRGVRLCEGAEVARVDPGVVTTRRGPVRARTVIVCAEAYAGSIAGPVPGLGPREVIPVNSAMIATEPLPERAWDRIGWEGLECLNDAAHAFVYAQRTADGRIAIGGRGSPYAFGSGTPGDGVVDPRTVRMLRERLELFFPGVEMPVAHAWRGVIGVTRDWCAGVHYDERTRIGSVRGYAGHGVTATNVAARTLLDRVAGRATALTRLPWNDHSSGRWEPEPVRWAGVHGMYRLFGAADSWEEARRSEKTSIIARIGSRLAGLTE
ncbi:FAD-binding oxidoreductase [Rothia sp. AR01]|uniref:FAD-binding oxidoreductase n=1 Tax=Rothia santali TaxID=2949643 RepID=A0A9X2HAA5_9MICC|nr:FAD-dependent oxidoreductase [Rothia santali]MCP3425909.1 FAD-binding oxidoreductase [Rothia santali]